MKNSVIDSILIYEPQGVENFYPFSVMHCIWELRCGVLRLFEKYAAYFPDKNMAFSGRPLHLNSFFARSEQKAAVAESTGKNILAVDGSVMPLPGYAEEVEAALGCREAEEGTAGKPMVFMAGGEVAAVYIPAAESAGPAGHGNEPEMFRAAIAGLAKDSNRVELKNCVRFNYSWDPIYSNGRAIADDLPLATGLHPMVNGDFPGVWANHPDRIYIGENCKIAPGVVLDADDGPIIISPGTKIMPNAVVLGPAFIGENCLIKIGAKIYHDCSFGQWCKIGGEVENSIMHSYSNKQHEGFLGHSYLGEWVNLGADTNNSDLKNTYSNIKIRMEGREIDSGRMFLGVICGDHTKTGINTMFTTGTVCGVAGILVREWFLPNFIPSFSWGGAKTSPIYKVSKAIETARIVMARRGKELLPEEEALLAAEHERLRDK